MCWIVKTLLMPWLETLTTIFDFWPNLTESFVFSSNQWWSGPWRTGSTLKLRHKFKKIKENKKYERVYVSAGLSAAYFRARDTTSNPPAASIFGFSGYRAVVVKTDFAILFSALCNVIWKQWNYSVLGYRYTVQIITLIILGTLKIFPPLMK